MHSKYESNHAPSPRPLRVLWLIKGLAPGGAEQLLILGARRVNRHLVSCDVAYVLASKNDLADELASEGIAVSGLGARSSLDPSWLYRLRALLRSQPYDIVHSHSPLAAAGARLVVRSLPESRRPRLVTTEHNLWDSYARPTARASALTARFDDARLAVSGAVRASMPATLQPRTEVMHQGVDVEAVRAAAAARGRTRAELGVADCDVVVGTVANLRSNKAYPDLLAAARIVIDQNPHARFVAVGQGPLEAELRALHARLGLGDRFRLLGYREDAVQVLSACDIFCLSSRYEGLPVALMEALVLGLPVVSTRVGGIPELVEDGCEGRLVPPGRPDMLAEALSTLVADTAARETAAAHARKRGDTLGIDQALRRTEELYCEVMQR